MISFRMSNTFINSIKQEGVDRIETLNNIEQTKDIQFNDKSVNMNMNIIVVSESNKNTTEIERKENKFRKQSVVVIILEIEIHILYTKENIQKDNAIY